MDKQFENKERSCSGLSVLAFSGIFCSVKCQACRERAANPLCLGIICR
jgi:hypothetical protein